MWNEVLSLESEGAANFGISRWISSYRFFAVILLSAGLLTAFFSLSPPRATAVLEQEDVPGKARSLSDRAMHKMSEGRFEPALADLREALALASHGNDLPLLASLRYRTGMVLRGLGRSEEALESCCVAVELAGDGASWVAILAENLAAEILNRLGRYEEALEHLSNADDRLSNLDRVPAEKAKLSARIHANIGVARLGTGACSAAVESFKDSVRLFPPEGAEKDILLTKLHLANALTLLARFSEAENLYREVVDRAGSSGKEKELGDGLSGLGLLLQYQGRQEEAEQALLAALQAHEASGDEAGTAKDRMNLAAVHLNRHDPVAAHKQYKAALEICRTLGRIPDQGFALAGSGYASLLSRHPAQAEAEVRAALDVLSDCECPSERAVAHEVAGRVELEQGRTLSAANHFTKALDLAESMGRPETVWRARAGLGDVRFRLGDLRAAADHYLGSVEAIESVRQALPEQDLKESYLYDKYGVYNSLVRTLLLLNEKYAALRSLDRRNQWAARDRLRLATPFHSTQRRSSYETGKALSARLAAVRDERRGTRVEGAGAGAGQARSTRVASAQQRLEGHLQGLMKTDPIMYRAFVTRPLDVERFAARLPRDTGVIAYFLDGEDCHVFSLTADSLHVMRRPHARKTIEETVRRMRATVRQPPSDRTIRADREPFREASKELYDLLVAPLDDAVHGKTEWYILPDEALWTVPFSALGRWTGEGEECLVSRHRITLVNTLDDIVPAFRNGTSERTCPALRLAAFGDAQQTLPAAAEEIKLLRCLDPEARLFAGKAATEQNARRFSQEANVLVFASHAARPPEETSALIRLAASDGEDGMLTAGEIRAWDLAHVDLVILSGCGTALSLDREQTFVSLADAFLFAGARAVLATLWDISDPGAYRFMERFVDHWKRSGDPARALRFAQNECIRGRSSAVEEVSSATRNRYVRVSQLEQSPGGVLLDLSHPYYWAAYVLLEQGLGYEEGQTTLEMHP